VFFGNEVLGLPNPTQADVRADYRAKTTDQAVREEVTNARRVVAANRLVSQRRRQLFASTQKSRKSFVDREVKLADQRVLAHIARVNASLKRHKVTVNGPALAAHNLRLDERAKRRAADRANAQFDAQLNAQVQDFSRSTLATADAPGVVGFFRFSYYELFEEQLRPLEIDYGVPETADSQPITQSELPPGTPSAALLSSPPSRTVDGRRIYPGPNCVFPSQLTITNGSYPYSRRFFLFTYRQAVRRSEVRDFLVFALQNARSLATQQRLVPITDAQLSDELFFVTGQRPQAASRPATGTTGPTGPTGPGGATGTSTGQAPAPAQQTGTPAPNAIPGVSSRGTAGQTPGP
jgi:hypothetical protein